MVPTGMSWLVFLFWRKDAKTVFASTASDVSVAPRMPKTGTANKQECTYKVCSHESLRLNFQKCFTLLMYYKYTYELFANWVWLSQNLQDTGLHPTGALYPSVFYFWIAKPHTMTYKIQFMQPARMFSGFPLFRTDKIPWFSRSSGKVGTLVFDPFLTFQAAVGGKGQQGRRRAGRLGAAG